MPNQHESQHPVDEHGVEHDVQHDVQQDTQDSAPRTPDAFDLRRLERDPDPMQYTDELRLRNQIFRVARDLYLVPAAARIINGMIELQAHFAVMVGGEFGEYRADLFIFEHCGMVTGQSESTRVAALQTLLETEGSLGELAAESCSCWTIKHV